MKSRKEILQDYINNAEEALVKLGIRMEYLQNKYAKENKQMYMQDLAQTTADQKETQEWLGFLKERLGRE